MKNAVLFYTIVITLISTTAMAQPSEPPLPEGLNTPAQNQGGSSEPPLPQGLGDTQSDEPALPQGLGSGSTSDEPSLPQGLGSETESDEPSLPSGLDSPEPLDLQDDVRPAWDQKLFGFPLHGFFDLRAGLRTQNDPYINDDLILGEARMQLKTEKTWNDFTFNFSGDLLWDEVENQLHTDLRTLNFFHSPLSFMDVRVGRQILTWGTGDLIFINDLFPKDWQAFFIGRDVEYLKAPSDAVKTSFFTDYANVDLIYVPQFDSDRFITGERISYWSDALGRRAGERDTVRFDDPDDWFDDDEFHYRIYRTISSYEVALYGYHGYWKSPGGMNPATGQAIAPELNAYGASVRGTVFSGIGNIEVGYYDSEEDGDGDDPFIKNSEFRFLIGYEQELARNFTGAVQYYLEYMMDYGAYRRTLPAGIPARDEDRHVLTLRLTKLLLEQDLELSMFGYFSPSDEDTYIRLNAAYKVTDNLLTTIGSNIFLGNDDHTFFSQFERNTNLYAGIRYSF